MWGVGGQWEWGTLHCLSPQEGPKKEAVEWASAGDLGRGIFSFLLKQCNKWLQMCFQRRPRRKGAALTKTQGVLFFLFLCPLLMAKYGDPPFKWYQHMMKAQSRSFLMPCHCSTERRCSRGVMELQTTRGTDVNKWGQLEWKSWSHPQTYTDLQRVALFPLRLHSDFRLQIIPQNLWQRKFAVYKVALFSLLKLMSAQWNANTFGNFLLKK